MKIFEKIVDIVDQGTQLPGKVARKADAVNDKLISIGQDIEKALAASGDVAGRNLTRNKIESLGRNAGTWLSDPGNARLAGFGIVGVVLLIFFFKKR